MQTQSESGRAITDRIQSLLEKDQYEMQGIYDAVAAGIHPDAAAQLVVGGEFQLSEYVKSALRGRQQAC